MPKLLSAAGQLVKILLNPLQQVLHRLCAIGIPDAARAHGDLVVGPVGEEEGVGVGNLGADGGVREVGHDAGPAAGRVGRVVATSA